MLNKDNIDLCWNVLAKYGIKHQMNMVMEECSELIKAVSKIFRYGKARGMENFIEELVDVIVVCQQMLLAFGISMDEVNKRTKNKLTKALKE